MNLHPAITRPAKEEFKKAVILQFYYGLVPIIVPAHAVLAFTFKKDAPGISFTPENIKLFYITAVIEPEEGLAVIAVIAAIVLALSLSSSNAPDIDSDYGDLVFTYHVKRILLIASGSVANAIALFVSFNLFVDSGAIRFRFEGFNSIVPLTIILALIVSTLSAARTRQRELEASQIQLEIQREQEKAESHSQKWQKRWGDKVPPSGTKIYPYALKMSGVIAIAWAATVALVHIGTEGQFFLWHLVMHSFAGFLVMFFFPFLFWVPTVHFIRNRRMFDSVLFSFFLLATYCLMGIYAWSSVSSWVDDPALNLLWVMPFLCSNLYAISCFISPHKRWPWWLHPVKYTNMAYYAMEVKLEDRRVRTRAKYISYLQGRFDKTRPTLSIVTNGEVDGS